MKDKSNQRYRMDHIPLTEFKGMYQCKLSECGEIPKYHQHKEIRAVPPSQSS